MKNARRIEVNADGLKEVLTSFMPTFLIMDIEGGEYDLLALQELHRSTITRMVVEFHDVVGLEEKFRAIKPLFESFFTTCSWQEALELLHKNKNLVVSFSRDNDVHAAG